MAEKTAEKKTTKKSPAKSGATKEVAKTPAKAPAKKEEKKGSEEFAVIETGGKQYVVAEGDVITIEKLTAPESSKGDDVKEYKEGDKITFDKVLLVDNGKDTTIGTPYIDGAKVIGTFQEEGKAKKIDVIKFKSKSRYFRKYGHRQPYSRVKIETLK